MSALGPGVRAFLAAARTATLATVDSDGRPRLVPICFVLDEAAPVVWTPLDDKPKRSDDPRALARVRDIVARPAVSILVDRWDEDWTRLAWVRVHGQAILAEPGVTGHATAVSALRAKYPSYADHRLEERPMIRVVIERAISWGAIGEPITDQRQSGWQPVTPVKPRIPLSRRPP